jgi:hypothetical protein
MIDAARTHFDLTAHFQMWLRCPWPLILVLFLIQALPSTANTEIINLAPSSSPRIHALDSISSNWPVLTPLGGQNERRWTMTHVPREGDAEGCIGKREWCEDDLWLVLDFDAEEWNAYRGFTLRISWPASVRPDRLYVRLFSRVGPLKPKRAYLPKNRGFCTLRRLCFLTQHPFDFQLEAYTPQDYALKAGLETTRIADIPPNHPKTRNMFARIRPINTGVLAPWAQRAIALNQTRSQAMRDYGRVEFITILEPLRFGGIPETLLPTIGFLIPLVLVAGFVVFPWIHTYTAMIAREARAELEGKHS